MNQLADRSHRIEVHVNPARTDFDIQWSKRPVIAIPAAHHLHQKNRDDATLEEVSGSGKVTRVTAAVAAAEFGEEAGPILLAGQLIHRGILGF